MITLAGCALVLLLAVYLYHRRRTANAASRPALSAGAGWSEKSSTSSGKPVRFQANIPPLDGFVLEDTDEIAYRPVRWNKHPVTMGISNMPFESWFQLDHKYTYLQKFRALKTRDDEYNTTETRAGFHDAALECLCETASFLALRYPKLFRVERRRYAPADESTWGDSFVNVEDGAVKVVHNLVTGDVWDFDAIEREEGNDWNPMKVAGQLTVEDLAMLCENDNQEYIFQAGHVATQGHWRFREKLGCTLHEIHVNGPVEVPGWRDVLRKSMERYFLKMTPEKAVQRTNFTFQNGSTLQFEPEKRRHANVIDPQWEATPEVLKSAEGMYFRVERQTLRRMPRSGALFFSFRTYLTPLLTIAKEPGVAGRMASNVRAYPSNVDEYNSTIKYKSVLLDFLDKAHADDIASGRVKLDEKGEEIRQKSYPF
ncbi:hypothetical protein Q8F55_006127 [Vanrija albida]|uniref:Uncharacterized protein n=1 Tax=Vanrija albida TaxID=181172 RepID=A0ABR3PWD1_9TREE